MHKRILKILCATITIIIYVQLSQHYHIYIPCYFHKITGLYCPGCGATRCILSLLKGNIYDAYRYNRLFFSLLPFLTICIIYKVYLYIFNKKDKYLEKIPKVIWSILLIITMLFGVVRNFSSFKYLIP